MSEQKKIFIDPHPDPVLEGPHGIKYDFNSGCRIEVPKLDEGRSWRIRIRDKVTHNVIFETTIEGGRVETVKKYYVPFEIECWQGEDLVFSHTMSLQDQKVQVQVPVGTLGDSLAWFSYIDLFQREHGCKLCCLMSKVMIDLLAPCYPNISFVAMDEPGDQSVYYASYRLGLFFNDWECTYQPVDFRYVGLHKTAAHILGVEPIETPPALAIKDAKRVIDEPYVCIAVQSSTQCKYWNNPSGWLEIVRYLKEQGYRVLCIDRDRSWGQGMTWTHIPHGAEDFTGNLPLAERAALLSHAEFFVGLSSGLAWLAWAAGTPVVMISGFTHPNNEFHTPYRVFNHHTCNSCWNDPKHIFDHYDFFWCPRHKGTDRQFECTRLITVDQVKDTIDRAIADKKSGTDQAKGTLDKLMSRQESGSLGRGARAWFADKV